MSLRSRLRRLERQKQAVDSRPPTDDELHAYALGEQVRPHVRRLLDSMREYAATLDPWHHLRNDWPA